MSPGEKEKSETSFRLGLKASLRRNARSDFGDYIIIPAPPIPIAF